MRYRERRLGQREDEVSLDICCALDATILVALVERKVRSYTKLLSESL